MRLYARFSALENCEVFKVVRGRGPRLFTRVGILGATPRFAVLMLLSEGAGTALALAGGMRTFLFSVSCLLLAAGCLEVASVGPGGRDGGGSGGGSSMGGGSGGGGGGGAVGGGAGGGAAGGGAGGGSGESDAGADCTNLNGTASDIWFVNRFTDRSLTVTWVDPSCQPAPVGTIEPQSTLGQTTSSGDVFQVKDAKTGEVLFNGPAEATTLIKIFPSTDTQVCSGISKMPQTVTFRNRYADRELSLFWVDPACKEHPAGDLAARSATTINTFVGDVFRFRLKSTGEVVSDVPPLTSTTTSVGVPADATAPACSDEGSTPSTITFQNNYPSKTVSIFWVDYKCQEVALGDVAPGNSLAENTFYTHVFRVRDATTKDLLASPAAVSAATVTVSVP